MIVIITLWAERNVSRVHSMLHAFYALFQTYNILSKFSDELLPHNTRQ